MDLPVSNMTPIESDKPSLSCGLCDLEVVQKLAQILLRGLSAACVNSTKGDPFKSPASVALHVRNEMVDYLTGRSTSYTSEPVIQPCDLEIERTEIPVRIISCFTNDFATLKNNLFTQISRLLPSEGTENKIDIFSQEIERNEFWPSTHRKEIAETLLRCVDLQKKFHCVMCFSSPTKLGEHKGQCGFRPVNCFNEGCTSCISAVHLKAHDLECPFKIIPCQQNCSQYIMRHKMDEHCNTSCPMKLVTCPFFQAGCQSTFPQCYREQHYSEFLHSHLLSTLQVIYRHEASLEDLRNRMLLLEKSQSLQERSAALDMRSLRVSIEEQETKMKKLENNLSKISRSR